MVTNEIEQIPPVTTRPRTVPVTVRPAEPDAWPPVRSARSVAAVHGLVVSVLTLGVVYTLWRAVFTLSATSIALAVALLLLEVWSLTALASQAIILWRLDVRPTPTPRDETDLSVAVLIATVDEPLETLAPTIAAATRMRLATSILVHDDGDRRWLAELCEELGVDYRMRSGDQLTPSGQMRQALADSAADLAVVVQPGQIVDSEFIGRTLGHFDDPRVALVQTPQGHYRHDSFEGAGGRVLRQPRMSRILAVGRNRINAATWSGGGAIVRVAAIADIGGIPTDQQTCELLTSVALHRRGWSTVQHDEILAPGSSPSDAAEYSAQQAQTCTETLQVARSARIFTRRGLSATQRISYLSSMSHALEGWRTLGYLLVPIIIAMTGQLPIAGPVLGVLVLLPLVSVSRLVAARALGAGRAPVSDLSVLGVIRMSATLRSTLSLVTGPPTSRPSPDRDARRVPLVISVLTVMSIIAVAWAVVSTLRADSTLTPNGLVIVAAGIWAAINTVILTRVVQRFRDPHLGGDRRASTRIEVDGHVHLDGVRVHLLDLSVTGMRVLSYALAPEIGSYCSIKFIDAGGRSALVTGTVAGIIGRPHAHEVRVHLEQDQTYVMGAILAGTYAKANGAPHLRG